MKRSRYLVAVVFAMFFVLSLVTNILGPIIPDTIQSFHLSLSAAALLPFSFFAAYGILSIPAGFMVEGWGEKCVILGTFSVALAGSLLFAWFHAFSAAIVSLFLIGSSMAVLQVAINPLLRVAGGEEHFAFNSAFAQLICGVASFSGPQIYSWIIGNLDKASEDNVLLRLLASLTPGSMHWISLYWVFTLVIAAIIVVTALSPFPNVKRKTDEAAGTARMYRSLLGRPMVWLYFFSVFFYVGSEQDTANWMSEFLWKYHGYDPHTAGASAVGWFWGLLTVGCFIGMVLLKLFDSRQVLAVFSLGALLCLSAALFGRAAVAGIAFPCVGLFASVMWPIILSLALNSISEYQGAFAGILCSGIAGGAIFPLVTGWIADAFGLRTGMCLLYVGFCWVFAVAFWARPLVMNQKLGAKKPSAEGLTTTGQRRREPG